MKKSILEENKSYSFSDYLITFILFDSEGTS